VLRFHRMEAVTTLVDSGALRARRELGWENDRIGRCPAQGPRIREPGGRAASLGGLRYPQSRFPPKVPEFAIPGDHGATTTRTSILRELTSNKPRSRSSAIFAVPPARGSWSIFAVGQRIVTTTPELSRFAARRAVPNPRRLSDGHSRLDTFHRAGFRRMRGRPAGSAAHDGVVNLPSAIHGLGFEPSAEFCDTSMPISSPPSRRAPSPRPLTPACNRPGPSALMRPAPGVA
jgi:hypothetical protein